MAWFIPLAAAAVGAGATWALNKWGSGSDEKHEQVPNIAPYQEPLAKQAAQAGLRRGAGGAFGESADYYRDNLSDNPADLEKFYRPEQRKFYEDVIPNLSEQFAGMGAGGLSSSGFRNSATSAGVDLAERLGALRANLRMQSAQGLQNSGQAGLGSFSSNQMTQQGSPGFWDKAAPAVTNAGVQLATDYAKSKWGENSNDAPVANNSSPYGGGSVGGASVQPYQKTEMPSFQYKM